MPYTIEFFNANVQAEIEAWPPSVYASFVRIVEQMESTGANLGLPYTRPMGDGLFEIRAKGKQGIGRAFFCNVIGKRIFILHGFIKKSKATPVKELRLAHKRLKEIENG